MTAITPDRDAFGQEIWNCYKGKTGYEIVERSDGLIDPGSAQLYFMEHKDWPIHEREAIRFAHGRALDIGCGAGRVALHLQHRGQKVLAIDNSPLAIKVSKLRGVKEARVLAIEDVSKLHGSFDTIVMYGNNFGLFGSRPKARRLLRAMHRNTSENALIIASAVNPYTTKDSLHLAYQAQNRKRGRMSGQIRMRVRYRQIKGNWFDYLLASPAEIRQLIANTGWQTHKLISSKSPGYVVILKKARA